MVATAIYSVTMVLWKETAFPLCRAIEKRWNRNVVSRVSSVIVVIRLPISCELNGHLMPCTSCLYGKWVEDVCTGQFGVLSILFCAVLWAAAPGLVAVLPMWDSAYVSVTSQAIGFPLAHGRRVVPSERLLSSRIRLIGSFTAGIIIIIIITCTSMSMLALLSVQCCFLL